MQCKSSDVSRLALAVLVGGLFLMAWVARSTFAGNPLQEAAAAPVALPGPPGQQKPEAPTSKQPEPSLALPKEDAPPLQSVPPTEVPRLDSSVESPATPSARKLESEDPEKDAQAFAEQNQKLAETQLKNLKIEAAKLRARLQKVDAGIKRWEVLLEALKRSQTVSFTQGETRGSTIVAPSEPSDLEPVGGAPTVRSN